MDLRVARVVRCASRGVARRFVKKSDIGLVGPRLCIIVRTYCSTRGEVDVFSQEWPWCFIDIVCYAFVFFFFFFFLFFSRFVAHFVCFVCLFVAIVCVFVVSVSALRVPPAETRLTVYRRLQLLQCVTFCRFFASSVLFYH